MIRVPGKCTQYLSSVGKSYPGFMSVSSTPSSAVGACRTEYKRQKTFMKTEKSVAKETQKDDSKDPLPIVELKPFVKKVWRRENSLPGFYNRFPPSKPSNHVRKHKEVEKKPDPPPSPGPSPDKLEMIIGSGSNENGATRSSGGPHSPRSRQKIHPSAETIAPKKREHSQSLVPGFITRLERTKTTLMEIQDAEAPTKVYCGLQQSLDRKEIDHPPVIDLKGEKNGRESNRKHYQYSPIPPFKAMYQKNGALNFSLPPQGYGAKYYPNKLRRRNSTERPKTPFYDAFDRKGTLPSIQIGIPTLRKRPNKSHTHFDNESDNLLDNAMPVSVSVHKVGGISNSLHLLSKIGAPTMVERQLSFQLEVDLRRFRRSRDYFPFDMTPTELAKYYPSQNISMTSGEKEIQKGLEQNTRRKKIRDKSHRSAPDKLETIDQLTPRDSEGTLTRLEGELAQQGRDKMSAEEDAPMSDDAQVNSVPNLPHTQETGKTLSDAFSLEEPNNNAVSVASGKAKSRSGLEMEMKYVESKEPILPLKINSGTPEGNEGSTEDLNTSPGGSSDIIQDVKDANILPDVNSANTEAIREEPEEIGGTSRSSTFITSEHTKFPEVVPS